MTFKRKVIRTTIMLGKGLQGSEGIASEIVLDGYRTRADLEPSFGASQGFAHITIYGLSIDLMNQLTTIGFVMTQIRGRNSIAIDVGEEGGLLTRAYQGTINEAWADFNQSPQIALHINAYGGLWAAVLPLEPHSFQGAVSVDVIVKTLVNSINVAAPGQNLVFVNNGVNIVLTDQYCSGSGWQQINNVLNDAGCFSRWDLNVLTIWPHGTILSSDVIHLSPNTDPAIIGYPTFSSQGIMIKSGFIPAFTGYVLDISDTVIKQANTRWSVAKVAHTLESEMPGGQWMTTMECWRFNPPTQNNVSDQ